MVVREQLHVTKQSATSAGPPFKHLYGSVVSGENSDEVIAGVLREVLDQGQTVAGQPPFLEVLNQASVLTDIRSRIPANSQSTFSLRTALARTLWHLSGRSDLESIAYYEPRAEKYSDDGLTLAGSNTGARILGRAGSQVNQLEGLIDRLSEDGATRRAAMTIWQPEDAKRRSVDIPCAMAFVCHVRDERLLTTVIMRSNNATRLLPYNLFEFSFMAELIATELSVQPGPYWHQSISMHILDPDRGQAEAMINAEVNPCTRMDPMPAFPSPLGQIQTLARCEELLRQGADFRSPEVMQASERLNPYWLGLLSILR